MTEHDGSRRIIRQLGYVATTIAVAGAGCAHHGHEVKGAASTAGGIPAATAALYDYDAAVAPRPTLSQVRETERYSVFRVHLPERPGSLFPAGGAQAVEYLPRGPAATPGVIVLPIQGGDYEISRYFAEYLADNGFACLRFERRAEWLDVGRDHRTLARLLREFVVDVRRGLHWWRASGRVDASRVGLLGVSMGAMMGTVVFALERDVIDRAVLALGGAHMPEIIMTGDDEELNRWRAEHIRRSGLSREDWGAGLRAAIGDLDPIHAAAAVPAERTLMIHARFDQVVRYPLATTIWEAAGRPERVVLPVGHYSTVLFIHYVRWKARAWLAGMRASPAAAVTATR